MGFARNWRPASLEPRHETPRFHNRPSCSPRWRHCPRRPSPASSASARRWPPTRAPEAVIRSIYDQYGPDSWPDDPYTATFSTELLKLWTEVDEGAKDDEEYAVDFDVFINAQDVDTVTNLTFQAHDETDSSVVIDASFEVFGEQQMVTYTMIKTTAGWKIDDISWSPESGLKSMLAELKQSQRKSR